MYLFLQRGITYHLKRACDALLVVGLFCRLSHPSIIPPRAFRPRRMPYAVWMDTWTPSIGMCTRIGSSASSARGRMVEACIGWSYVRHGVVFRGERADIDQDSIHGPWLLLLLV